QLADDFEPNDTNRRVAEEHGVSLAAELPQFCDHHRAKGSTMKDWHAALNTWLRRARKFEGGGPTSPPGRTPSLPPESECLDPDNPPPTPPGYVRDWNPNTERWFFSEVRGVTC